MTPIETLAILGLTVFAIYRQTRTTEVTEDGRFKLAIIYAVIGLVIGGFAAPHGFAAYALLAVSFVLSAVVGLARGHLTRIWAERDGRVYTKGTPVTIALFLGLIACKFGLGALAYIWHINDGEGFGEVLVMIAVMIAVQAEIVWRRAAAMGARRREVAGATV